MIPGERIGFVRQQQKNLHVENSCSSVVFDEEPDQ